MAQVFPEPVLECTDLADEQKRINFAEQKGERNVINYLMKQFGDQQEKYNPDVQRTETTGDTGPTADSSET